jgi:hypothetical protein
VKKLPVIAGVLLCAAAFSLWPDEALPMAGFPELYISPNNDGVKDTLTVPFTISEKRYIKEWRLVVTDEEIGRAHV